MALISTYVALKQMFDDFLQSMYIYIYLIHLLHLIPEYYLIFSIFYQELTIQLNFQRFIK